MITFAFDSKKAAQAAALLLRWNQGEMDKYLFIKLLYLADRAALEKWKDTITGDRVFSMQHGPVLSTIYDLTKGTCTSSREGWEEYIAAADPESNQVSLKSDPGTDLLSRAEIRILRSKYDEFHNYTWVQMRDFCHALPEYVDVGQSSKPLAFEDIMAASGRSKEEIAQAAELNRQTRLAELLFA